MIMEKDFKENGKMTKNKMEHIIIKMEINTQDSIKMENLKGRESITLKMEVGMKGNLDKANFKEEE